MKKPWVLWCALAVFALGNFLIMGVQTNASQSALRECSQCYPGARCLLRKEGNRWGHICQCPYGTVGNGVDCQAREALVTLLYGNKYNATLSTLALLESVLHHGSNREFVVMVTPEVSQYARALLTARTATVVEVEAIRFPYSMDNMTEYRMRWTGVYTKLAVWSLTDYSRLVFIDGDCVVNASVDALFSPQLCPYHAHMCAVPDVNFWHANLSMLNTGVMTLRPNARVFERMLQTVNAGTEIMEYVDQEFIMHQLMDDRWRVYALPLPYNSCGRNMSDARIVHACGDTKLDGYPSIVDGDDWEKWMVPFQSPPVRVRDVAFFQKMQGNADRCLPFRDSCSSHPGCTLCTPPNCGDEYPDSFCTAHKELCTALDAPHPTCKPLRRYKRDIRVAVFEDLLKTSQMKLKEESGARPVCGRKSRRKSRGGAERFRRTLSHTRVFREDHEAKREWGGVNGKPRCVGRNAIW